jgi:hypothetical protein
VKLLKALVWPIVSYGAEGWTLKKADENRIMAAEMWFYRRIQIQIQKTLLTPKGELFLHNIKNYIE